jgi:PhnB protein
MEFYKSVLGGELTVSTFAELGGSKEPADKDLIMHAQLITGAGYWLMASDTPSHVPYAPAAGISVSLSGDDEAMLTGYWTGLSAGAAIAQPLSKAPWGDSFGMLTDKFGIAWLVNIAAPGRGN